MRVEHRDEADYGRALRAGLLGATGDAVVNFDADYFDLDFLDAAVAQVLAPGGPAIVVGSKRGAGATDTRAPLRKVATLGVQHDPARASFGLVGLRHARHEGDAPRRRRAVRRRRASRARTSSTPS